MDQLTHYREQIKQVLTQYADVMKRQPTPGIDTELVFDDIHDQYLLLKVGWWPQVRVRGATANAGLKRIGWKMELSLNY